MSDTNGELVFDDLEPKHVNVRLRLKSGEVLYTLHQATEAAACKAENYRHRKARLTEDGRIITVDGMADAVPYLVSLCLKTADAEARPVPLDAVLALPPNVVRKLHDWILTNSGMAPEETVEYLRDMIKAYQRRLALVEKLTNGELAKNSQGVTEGTSD